MDTTRDFALFEPGALMRRILRDAERLLREPPPPAPQYARRGFGEFPWAPEMEVFEREGRLTVRLDLPGLKQEEVSVTVAGDALTIEGERKYELEDKKKDWYTTERTTGSSSGRSHFPKASTRQR